MVAIDVAGEVVPFVIPAIVVLAGVAWLVLTRFFGETRAGRHAGHFLDAGDAEMKPADRVKYNNQHPGAGGNG